MTESDEAETMRYSFFIPLALLFFCAGCVSLTSVGIKYLREVDAGEWATLKSRFEHIEGVILIRGESPYDCGPEALAAMRNYFRPGSCTVREVASELRIAPGSTSGISSLQIPIYLRGCGIPAVMQVGTLTLLRQNCLIGNPVIIMVDTATVPDSPIPLAERPSQFHFFVVVGYSEELDEVACAAYDGSYVVLASEYLEKAWAQTNYYTVVVGNREPDLPTKTSIPAAGTGQLLRSGTAEQHFDFGTVYEQEGRLDDAEAQYKFCLEQVPNHVPAHVGLGNIHLRRGNTEEAQRWYEKALQIDPNLPIALNNLAWLRVETRTRLNEAEDLATRAIAGYRLKISLLETEAAVARSLGGKEAQETSMKVERKRKQGIDELARAMDTRGHALFLQEKFADAVGQWNDALNVEFVDDEFRAKLNYNIGRAYAKTGNPSAAEASFRTAFRLTKQTELLRKIGEELELLRRGNKS
jgi:tetratricopeptide (TPR) repeat protein